MKGIKVGGNMYYFVRLIISIALFFLLVYVIPVKRKIFKISILIISILFYALSSNLYIENVIGFKSAEQLIRYKNNGNIEKIVENNNNCFLIYSKKNGDLSFQSTYEKNGRWYFNNLKTDYVWCGNSAVAICKERKANYYLVVMFVNDEKIKDNQNSQFQYYEYSLDNKLYYTYLSVLDDNYELTIDNITYKYSKVGGQFSVSNTIKDYHNGG